VDIKLIQMLNGARNAIKCANVRSGERVLIITDTQIDFSISMVLAMAAAEAGAEPIITIMLPRRAHGDEPPLPIKEAMLSSDVIFTPTSKTLFHSQAARDACRKGARMLSMTGITPLSFMKGAGLANFEEIEPVVIKLAELLTQAETLRLKTPAGTDLKASIKGRSGNAEPGIVRNKGEMGGWPDIEVNIAPIEDSVEGTVVIDVTATDFGFVDVPIRIEIRNGRAVKIEGGVVAEKLRELLESANDPNQYVVAEIGFGLNPNAELQGRIIEDESALGTAHIAFGNNLSLGGKNKAPYHVDLVMKDPILELDGKKIIEKKKILL